MPRPPSLPPSRLGRPKLSPSHCSNENLARSTRLLASRLRPKNAAPLRRHHFATLGSFVTGPSNRLARAAVETILQRPGQISPLLIYGPTSVGKTHLLQGNLDRRAAQSVGPRRGLYHRRAIHDVLRRGVARQRVAQFSPKVSRRSASAHRRSTVLPRQAFHLGRIALHGRYNPPRRPAGGFRRRPVARRNCPSWAPSLSRDSQAA